MGFSDPYISTPVEVEQDTHDDLNVNANMQVGDVDVSAANPVPSVADHVSTTETDYNVAITNADTEYSQALPTDTKRFTFQCRGDVDVRWSFATGKVATPTAPYNVMKTGYSYWEDTLDMDSKTLYFAADTGSQVVELTVYT